MMNKLNLTLMCANEWLDICEKQCKFLKENDKKFYFKTLAIFEDIYTSEFYIHGIQQKINNKNNIIKKQ